MAMVAPPSAQLRLHNKDAYHPAEGPGAYEDQIVPALRRRLAQESRELTKRMSTHITTPLDLTGISASTEDENSLAPPPNAQDPIPRIGDTSNSSSNAPLAPNRTRKRTYSTPFAFDPSSSDAARRPPRTSEALRSVSSTTRPGVLSSTRSRIPTASSRTPSTSKSNRNDPLLSTISSSSLSSDHNTPRSGSHHPIDATTSELMSPLEFEPLTDEQLTSLAAEFPSEEDSNKGDGGPQYEHWYRGEGRDGGGRNGGRGEIRAGTQEMLAIALGGHAAPDRTHRDSWLRPSVDDNDLSDSHERWHGSGWDEEYVPDERMLTDMEVDGNGTDVDTMGASTPSSIPKPLPNAQPPKTPQRMKSTHPNTSPSNQNTPTQSRVRSTSKTNGPTQTSYSRSTSTPKAGGSSGTQSRRATPRVRRKSSFPPSSSPPASRSAYDLSIVSKFAADAVPKWDNEPTLPPSGNWDEVVLPTIAKKMKKAQDDSEPNIFLLGSTSQSPNRPISRVPPAPGTFDYNESKEYRDRVIRENGIEMQDISLDNESVSSKAKRPVSDISPTPISPPPKSQTPSLHPSASHATPNPSSLRIDAVDLRKSKPAIRVTSPSINSLRKEEDEHGGGCCRCVVM